MTAQELKNSVLRRAFRGELVERRVEEGTGAELLKQIEAEKAALTKAGKLKKEKPLPPITEEEKPFEIPEHWTWTRLVSVAEIIMGQSPKGEATTADSRFMPLIGGAADMKPDSLTPTRYTKEPTKISKIDDVILCIRATLGKPVFADKEYCLGRGVAAIRSTLPKKFIRYFFLSFEQYLYDKATGTTFAQVTGTTLAEMPFPLPPLAEQARIVAKLEEIWPEIERYAAARDELEALNRRFPNDLRKAVLQSAIRGELVERRDEEGTGAELLRQIEAEKASLTKAGKLKKEKPLPPIADEEKPFEIPEHWTWTRLGNIGSWAAGATPSRSNPAYYRGNIPWLKTGDLNDEYISETSETISELALEKTSVRLNPIGSVLMAMYGATIGKLGILNIEATTNQACCACIPFSGMLNKFLFYFLMAQRTAFIQMGAGGAQPNISKEKIVRSLIPLPPLAEQARIVAKLEEILPLCDRLR